MDLYCMRRRYAAVVGITFIFIALQFKAASAQDGASAYREAVSDIRQGKFAAAIPLLEGILATTPTDLRARNLMGIALSEAGRRAEANEHFQRALLADPKFYPALKNLAVNELALGRVQDARGHFEEVLKLAPQDPVAHFGLGEIESGDGNFERALAQYEQSGDLYLKDPRAILNYAHGCMQAKQPGKAVQTLGSLPPNTSAAIRFEAGLLLAKLEEYQAATQQFQLAKRGFPDPYKVGFNLVLAYLKSKNYSAAIQEGEKLMSSGHNTAELHNLLAQAYEAGGHTKEAYESLRAATELNPRDEASYLDLIALCLEHQSYDLALEIADIGLRVIPGSNRLRLERGIVLAVKGRLEEAEKEFESSTRSGPEAGLGYVASGLVLMQMNRLPEAIDVLRRRREQKPDDYLANWFLAEALSRYGSDPGSGVEAEAIHALEQSIQSDPRLPQSRVLFGRMLLRRGETDRAIEQLEKALEIDPDSVPAAYQLAQVYRKKGNTRRADELFAKISKAKEEDREQFTQRSLLRLVREGSH